MDINNIAVVRATNAIPFDGEVHPVKDIPFIKKENDTDFAREMFQLLRRKGLLHPIDWEAPEEERTSIIEKNKEILEQYMPYTSIYNSMVLWSLNALVPDDARNLFSKKTCAVIDGLKEQLDQSEIVSLVPTDTAIKGPVKLSKSAIICIAKQRYEELSQEKQEQLKKLDLNVVIFEGDLKTAVDTILTETGRYTAETLTLVNECGGYEKSATSGDVMQVINNIAKEKDIPQVLHDKVFRGEIVGEEKLESVKGEIQQCDVVSTFYSQSFFKYLFSRMDIDETTKTYVQIAPDITQYIENLCDEIGRIGIDKYKEILDSYNQSLERLQKLGKLPTPQEIVNSSRENKKIDLISIIEEHSNEDTILSSAIEATEERTRTGVMDKQMENFKQLTKEINEKTKGVEIE